jgi:hypothetical protein
MPPHWFRLQAIDIVLRCHRGLQRMIRRAIVERRCRQQRRRLDDASGFHGHGRACGETQSEFQKMTAFHRNPS